MTDYSQTGEQEQILQFADELGRPGRFLDIGAFDGFTFSNTRALAEQGWAGVCVEPAAHAFHKLALLYADRDDVLCVNALIGVDGGLTGFWYATGDLVSTTEPGHLERWKDAAEYVRTIVAAVTLADLIRTVHGGFDMVSIDTEGTELRLLEELVRLPCWEDVGLVVVEPSGAKTIDQVLRICGREWIATGRTANNLILGRRP